MKFNKKALAIGVLATTLSSASSAGFLTMDWVNALQAHAKTIIDEIQHNEKLIAAAELYQSKIVQSLIKTLEDQQRSAQELRDSSQLEVDQYQTELVKEAVPSIGGCGILATQSTLAKNECVETVITNYKLDESKNNSSASGSIIKGLSNNDEASLINDVALAYGKEGETFTGKDIRRYIENPGKMNPNNYVTIREQINLTKLVQDEKPDFVNNLGLIDGTKTGDAAYNNDVMGLTDIGIRNMYKKGKTLNPDELNTSFSSLLLMVPDYTPDLQRRPDSINLYSKINDLKGIAYTEAAKLPYAELINERTSLDSDNIASPEEAYTFMSDELMGIDSVNGTPLVDLVIENNNSSVQQSEKLVAELMRAKLLADYKKLKDSIFLEYQLAMRLALKIEKQ